MNTDKIIIKDNVKHLIAFVLLLLFCLISQKQYLKEFPKYIHAWSQSDRYALAVGFTKNGLDLFHPQTYYLNNKLFETGGLAKPEGITAVDFPVNEYVVAVFMKVFNSTSPLIFRFYILMYSFIGLFFLYLIGYKLLKDPIISFLAVILIMFSPVYFYYQSGFLPTITAISNVFAGMYFYLNYIENRKTRNFVISVSFFTLAALMRTPFIIMFFALFFSDCYLMFTTKKLSAKRLFVFFAGLFIIVAYYLYNSWLRHKYGSLFLSELMYTFNFSELKLTVKDIYKNWFFQYFSMLQYIVFAVVTVLAAVLFYLKKVKISGLQKSILVYTLLGLAASTCYLFIMLLQFINHDYYFLDCFFTFLAIGFVMFLSFINLKDKIYNYSFAFILAALCYFTISATLEIQLKRRDPGNWDRTFITYTNYLGSDKFLDDNKIPDNAKMLVFEGYSYNIPQLLMKRKGFSLNAENELKMKAALNWPYDYIIIQDCYLVSDVIKIYPEIINIIDKIGGNGRISIYKKLQSPVKTSLLQFLKLDKQTPLFSAVLNIASPDSCWKNFKKFESDGLVCGQILPTEEFGISLKLKNFAALSERNCILMFSSKINIVNQNFSEANVVTSIDSVGKSLYYTSFDLKNQVEKSNSWQKVNLLFNLPVISSTPNSTGIYIWNKGKNEILYDSLRVDIY
jgi:hypothetical protein